METVFLDLESYTNTVQKLANTNKLSLASQIHFCKNDKGLVSCVYKLCPTTQWFSVSSKRCDNSLKNSERGAGHLFHCYRNYNKICTLLLEEYALFATDIPITYII